MQVKNGLDVQKQAILSDFERNFPEVFSLLQNGIFYCSPENKVSIAVNNKGTAIIDGK